MTEIKFPIEYARYAGTRNAAYGSCRAGEGLDAGSEEDMEVQSLACSGPPDKCEHGGFPDGDRTSALAVHIPACAGGARSV